MATLMVFATDATVYVCVCVNERQGDRHMVSTLLRMHFGTPLFSSL